MIDPNAIHYSVLKDESISSLQLTQGLTVVDATVNRGGHAVEIAKAIGPTGKLIIFDLDKEALEYSRKRLEGLPDAPQIIPVHSNYRYIKEELERIKEQDPSFAKATAGKVDRIFADLGLSSQELEISGRGFSFQKDEPLYMTFQSEVNKDTFTALDLLNNLPVSSLEQIFRVYGDEHNAWKIANAIVERREELKDVKPQTIKTLNSINYPIKTTKQLVEIIESVSPRKGKTHPATKVFQAIRIAVNDEYESIKQFVTEGYNLLNNNGIFSIITFHSGEDRIVKKMFNEYTSKDNKQSKIKPTRKEILENKRSRSAILRSIQKIK